VYDRRQSEAPATAWLALRQLVRQVIPVDRVYAARALKTQLWTTSSFHDDIYFWKNMAALMSGRVTQAHFALPVWGAALLAGSQDKYNALSSSSCWQRALGWVVPGLELVSFNTRAKKEEVRNICSSAALSSS